MKVVPKLFKVKEINWNSGTKKISLYGDTKFISDIKNLQFIINNIHSKKTEDYIPRDKIVYIAKNSELPRFKLKDYLHTNKIRKTKLPSSAQIVLLNKPKTDYFLNNISKENFYFIPTESIPQIIIDECTGVKFLELDGLVIGVSNIYVKDIFKKIGLKTSSVQTKNSITVTSRGAIGEKLLFENLFEIANNKECALCFDEKILEQLNEKGHELDEEYVESLTKMFISADKNNWELALELIANSNYKTSIIEVFILITDNWKRVLDIKHNQNVRSFLFYIDSLKINYKEGWKIMFGELIKKYQNEPEVLVKIKTYLAKKIKEGNKELGIGDINFDFENNLEVVS